MREIEREKARRSSGNAAHAGYLESAEPDKAHRHSRPAHGPGDGRVIGVIEAKPEGHTLKGVDPQPDKRDGGMKRGQTG
jgi:hypothetical protein